MVIIYNENHTKSITVNKSISASIELIEKPYELVIKYIINNNIMHQRSLGDIDRSSTETENAMDIMKHSTRFINELIGCLEDYNNNFNHSNLNKHFIITLDKYCFIKNVEMKECRRLSEIMNHIKDVRDELKDMG